MKRRTDGRGVLAAALARAEQKAHEDAAQFAAGTLDHGGEPNDSLATVVADWRYWEDRAGLTSEYIHDVVLSDRATAGASLHCPRLVDAATAHYFATLDVHAAADAHARMMA